METVTNTANNTRVDWLFGGNPNAIEAQEARGQQELVNSSQLPVKVNSRLERSIKEQYALMGIKVIDYSKGDTMFYDAELPQGWKKVATDHDMWSKLLDDRGRKRASIFYKAAFYDRDAFINFNSRYVCSQNFTDKRSEEGNSIYTDTVVDNQTGTILFETKEHTYKEADEYRTEALKFITDNYPNYMDINAYWD